MYLPKAFAESERDTLFRLILDFPLATLVMPSSGDVVINHLPLLHRSADGAQGTLVGHVPRSNDVWQAMDGNATATAVFQGANAYITPSWYPSKHEHGRAVPTWNYAVVHVRGRPRSVDDGAWIREHLDELTNTLESGQARPWKLSDAPAEFTSAMIDQLVGIEMPIESIEGKWKVSQNRSRSDREGVVAGLKSRGNDAALAVATMITDRIDDGA